VSDRFKTKDEFYGYPAHLVAEWCCVSVQTARNWKSGIRRPSPHALKLFLLHRDGQIIPASWRRWKFVKEVLYDPESGPLTERSLRAYGPIQSWREGLKLAAVCQVVGGSAKLLNELRPERLGKQPSYGIQLARTLPGELPQTYQDR